MNFPVAPPETTPSIRAGHSGYPKFSGRVVRVLGISGFQKWYPKSVGKNKNPKIRVRVLPELPEILELHICSIKSNQIHPTIHPVHTSKLTVQTKLTNTSHVQTVTVHTSHITIDKHSFEAHKSNHRWKNKWLRQIRFQSPNHPALQQTSSTSAPAPPTINAKQ